MTTLLYLYVGFGLLLAVLAIPLILGKVPPNPIYGMRTSTTLSDPELWYPANRYMGKWLFWIAIVYVITAAGLYFIPGFSVDTYALACLGALIVLFGVGIWRGLQYLKNLQA